MALEEKHLSLVGPFCHFYLLECFAVSAVVAVVVVVVVVLVVVVVVVVRQMALQVGSSLKTIVDILILSKFTKPLVDLIHDDR